MIDFATPPYPALTQAHTLITTSLTAMLTRQFSSTLLDGSSSTPSAAVSRV